MVKKILLVEPNYKNKYPPMGLMKISTYHKKLGDNVLFYKGDFNNFIVKQICEELFVKLYHNDSTVNWKSYKNEIETYIKRGLAIAYEKLVNLSKSTLIGSNLKYYRKYFTSKGYLDTPTWDRIYITTLFTFYWKQTIDSINSFKSLCKNIDGIKVGGIAATLLPEEIFKETGIYPQCGLLDKGGEFDQNGIIIDHLPLDYSILYDIDYNYPENDGYYGYTTRGCVNSCPFCAVPQLEPIYNEYVSIKDQIAYVKENFGEKRNLLLLDNNVLASEKFDNIIDEIKSCGFSAGAKFIEPNKYNILFQHLKKKQDNYSSYINRIVSIYSILYKKLTGTSKTELYIVLSENNLLSPHTATKEAILKVHDFFSPLYEKHRYTRPKSRYVDFNQGLDARLFTPEKAKKIAEIAIRPLRIAFDSWNLRSTYEKAIRLAAENGIKEMSNYVLYNYNEKPIDLFLRLQLNIRLCEELDINIYSFPMKYHPIQDPLYFKNRAFLGKHWNRKFIRSIQAILNSTKGKIGRGKAFFEKAFGQNEREYFKLLYMPEVMIIYRLFYEKIGMTDEWWNAFSSLSEQQLAFVKPIIHKNDFSNISTITSDKNIINLLKFYTISRNKAAEDIKHLNPKELSQKANIKKIEQANVGIRATLV